MFTTYNKLAASVMNSRVRKQCLVADYTPFLFLDWDGIRNLVSAMPQTIKRLVLVSSIGVTKYNELPWRYTL